MFLLPLRLLCDVLNARHALRAADAGVPNGYRGGPGRLDNVSGSISDALPGLSRKGQWLLVEVNGVRSLVSDRQAQSAGAGCCRT